MNWLIYIVGWIFGWYIVNGLVEFDMRNASQKMIAGLTCTKFFMWTCAWIWICWKFIR